MTDHSYSPIVPQRGWRKPLPDCNGAASKQNRWLICSPLQKQDYFFFGGRFLLFGFAASASSFFIAATKSRTSSSFFTSSISRSRVGVLIETFMQRSLPVLYTGLSTTMGSTS